MRKKDVSLNSQYQSLSIPALHVSDVSCLNTAHWNARPIIYLKHNHQEKICSKQQFSGQECLVDTIGQRRMAKPAWDDRRATVTSDANHQLWQAAVFKARKLRLQFTQAHQNWALEDWKIVAWSNSVSISAVTWKPVACSPRGQLSFDFTPIKS